MMMPDIDDDPAKTIYFLVKEALDIPALERSGTQ